MDTSCQGKRLGEFLLADACLRVLGASQAMGVFALIVEAKDATAVGFYQRYGFQRFPDTPHRLFLPTETLLRANQARG